MTALWSERVKMSVLGWLATILTSLSFLPALEDKSYVIKAALLTAAVVGLGAVLRGLRTPAVVVFVAQLLVLVELLLLRYGDDFRWGLLPTEATLSGLEDLIRDGFDVAQRYAAPAPPNTGLMMMVLFAICLVAIVVDAIAVGLGRVPLSGLPLLALYTIPVAALPEGVPFYAFVPGAATYIAMLTADERDRLVHWGRLVRRSSTAQESSRIDTSGLHATGRQVSVLALTIAVIVPIFVPALSSSILDAGRVDGTGGNESGRILSFDNPMVSLANQLRRKTEVDLMRIRGDISPEYLRLVVLDNPGPDAWTASPTDLDNTNDLGLEPLPTPLGQGDDVASAPHEMRITLTDDFPQDSSWLPVPFGVDFVRTDAPFAYVPRDQTVTARADDAIRDVTPYDVSYNKPQPSDEQLRATGPAPADIVANYGDVPSDIPPIVAETAQEVTASATSAYDQAVLLQNYFRGSGAFSYSLDAGYGSGYQAMGQFLSRKVGFCQQFAATMAMMARTLGIPSRVVVGFLESSRTERGDYIITSNNVHAWPELYFEGIGWVNFEPTPGISAPYPEYAPQTSATTTGPTQSAFDPDTVRPTDTGLTASPTTEAAAGGGGSGDGFGPPFLPARSWLILLAVMALILLPAGLRYGVRRARLTRPIDVAEGAEAAWAELRDHVRDLRLAWVGSMTPRARERDVRKHLAEVDERRALDALHRLAMTVERARYSLAPAEGSKPAADARIVMASISRAVDWPQRVRAFFWPTSLMPDIRRGWKKLTGRLRRQPQLT
jgi:transglutaminase-like putative cysteine protease